MDNDTDYPNRKQNQSKSEVMRILNSKWIEYPVILSGAPKLITYVQEAV